MLQFIKNNDAHGSVNRDHMTLLWGKLSNTFSNKIIILALLLIINLVFSEREILLFVLPDRLRTFFLTKKYQKVKTHEPFER